MRLPDETDNSDRRLQLILRSAAEGALFQEIKAAGGEDVQNLARFAAYGSVQYVRRELDAVSGFDDLRVPIVGEFEFPFDDIRDLFMRMGVGSPYGPFLEIDLHRHEVVAMGKDFPSRPAAEFDERGVFVVSEAVRHENASSGIL